MTGPDRIFAKSWVHSATGARGVWSTTQHAGTTEYIRRDPAVIAALPEVQALIRQAVEAEREALQQERDTNRRFQRRMQLLEGWWQRRVERADKWRKVWQRIYYTDVLDVRALTEADYQRGYEDGLHDRVKIPTQRRVAAIRKRGDAALCECGHYTASPLDGDCVNCGSPVNPNQTK